MGSDWMKDIPVNPDKKLTKEEIDKFWITSGMEMIRQKMEELREHVEKLGYRVDALEEPESKCNCRECK